MIFCTAISLAISNTFLHHSYSHIWHYQVLLKPVEFWINDGLMTVFFLLVGLEISREVYVGELSDVKKSMLPVVAAVGGMVVPAGIHFIFNHGKITEHGFGIPMATDIAFSLAVLSLLGSRVPASLKIFLTALAIIDDLGAILVIALFYSKNFDVIFFSISVAMFAALLLLNKVKIMRLEIYLIIGCALWYCMYRTGIHPTLTGVLLAFAIPFGNGRRNAPHYKLQHFLHRPVAYFILPLFALANTAIVFPQNFMSDLFSNNSMGIGIGLLAGKPVGIFLFSILAATFGICTIPSDISKNQLWGTGLLAGIGFTMSIFISLLAFTNPQLIDSSKIAVLAASLLAGLLGYVWLRFALK